VPVNSLIKKSHVGLATHKELGGSIVLTKKKGIVVTCMYLTMVHFGEERENLTLRPDLLNYTEVCESPIQSHKKIVLELKTSAYVLYWIGFLSSLLSSL